MYIQRRMTTEEGTEITAQIMFVQICELKSTGRTENHTRRRYIWNKM